MKIPRPEVGTRLPLRQSRGDWKLDCSLSTAAGQVPAPEDNWCRLGDVVSDILADVIARRHNVSQPYAHVVTEHAFNRTGKIS